MKEIIEYATNRIIDGFQAKYGDMRQDIKVSLPEIYNIIRQQEEILIKELIKTIGELKNVSFGEILENVKGCGLKVDDIYIYNTNRNYVYNTYMYHFESVEEIDVYKRQLYYCVLLFNHTNKTQL